MSVGNSSASKMFIIVKMPRDSEAEGMTAIIRCNQFIVVSNVLSSVVSFNWLHIPTARVISNHYCIFVTEQRESNKLIKHFVFVYQLVFNITLLYKN